MPIPCPDLLNRIDDPADLRHLSRTQLAQLADELRDYLLASVARTGGHLAANLGVIELTIALHTVFETPNDHLVWDVGHQAYAHKMLTGRRRDMARLRDRDGPAGFTRRSESPYDPFGAGHSSTSISAALGMAIADRIQGRKHRSIAVIGDGALTAGQAFEALNHAGDTQANLLVVLNDNDMSISANVGALNQHLTRLRSNPVIDRLRRSGKELLDHGGPLGELMQSTRIGLRDGMKHLLGVSSLFEELGLTFYGPIDGHDLPLLLDTLENLRDQPGPRLLHVVTQKGRGYAAAEEDPTRFHGVGAFSLKTPGSKSSPKVPEPPRNALAGINWTEAFAQWLDKRGEDPKLIVITPAMLEGSGLTRFHRHHPDRCLDVGIAEQHAVTLAGGLSTAGMKPVVAIYSTFLQRAWDQVIHDIALQNLDVLFAIDRAGLVGPDGATHAGSFDLALGHAIPNLTIAAPADQADLNALLDWGYTQPGPVLVRYPRGTCPVDLGGEPAEMPHGMRVRQRCSSPEQGILVVAIGATVETALAAAEGLPVTVVDPRVVKPIDWDGLAPLIEQHAGWLVVEEGAAEGGIGQGLVSRAAEAGLNRPVRLLGLPDRFIEHGSRSECLTDAGLDVAQLRTNIQSLLPGESSRTSRTGT
jgi:1-deoxy-D-xylulose-5-phosphate synthase